MNGIGLNAVFRKGEAETQNLINVLDDVPPEVKTEFYALGTHPATSKVLALQRKYKLTPEQVKTLMKALDFASPVIKNVMAALRRADGKSATVTLTTRQRTIKDTIVNAPTRSNRTLEGMLRADGGLLRGPGGPREDRIPAMLSNGEFVVNAAATKSNLDLLHAINSQKYKDGGKVGRFAAGGVASRPTSSARSTIDYDRLAKAFMAQPGGPSNSISPTFNMIDRNDVSEAMDKLYFTIKRVESGGRYART